MSKLPEEIVLHHIKRGVSQLTPNRAEELWERPVVPADGSEWYLDPDAGRAHTHRKKRMMGALAACFALCILSTLLFQCMPSASVYLDVNPSVELRVNYRDRVTTARACNADAEVILEDMDLRGTDLDVALYAILGSMVHHGYLTEAKDTILVSVHSANTGRARQLEAEATDMVAQSLDKMIQAGEVLSHQINEEDVDRTECDYGGTPGKAAFVDDLEDRYPQLKEDDLDEMTVDEIVSHLDREGLDYSEYRDDDDDDDDDDDRDDDRDDDHDDNDHDDNDHDDRDDDDDDDD